MQHELVPVPLVESIASLRHGGTTRCLKLLLKAKLLHHENVKYDGYRLTYLGYDYLAIKTLLKRGSICSVGPQIGVGKEADVFQVKNERGETMALKLHRLGRTSFRAVKAKRDYLKHRSSFSWLYLSRLAALKEYAFMAALDRHGFPVPKPIDNSRHAVLMTLIDGSPLVQTRTLKDPGAVFRQCMEIIAQLAGLGLIHCDFNEFNLLIDDNDHLTLIDFPQMVSVGHANAREFFNRDVECVDRYFKKKIGYIPENDKEFPFIWPDFEEITSSIKEDIGPELRASGFEREHQMSLEQWISQQPLDNEVTEGNECDGEHLEMSECDQHCSVPDQSFANEEGLLPVDGSTARSAEAASSGQENELAAPVVPRWTETPANKIPSQSAVHERVHSEMRRAVMTEKDQSKARKNVKKKKSSGL